MKILFMDDSIPRHNQFRPKCIRHDVDFTTNIRDTKRLLNSRIYDIVFLDHDLDGRCWVKEVEGTGTEMAHYITTIPPEKRPKLVVVHSKFDWGANRMMKILQAAGVNAVRHAFYEENFAEYLLEC